MGQVENTPILPKEEDKNNGQIEDDRQSSYKQSELEVIEEEDDSREEVKVNINGQEINVKDSGIGGGSSVERVSNQRSSKKSIESFP